MSKSFTSMTQFARELSAVAKRLPGHLDNALEQIGGYVETVAKAKLGDYQTAAWSPQGEGFPAWEPLQEATEQEKERLGYSRDEPEIRTHDMQNSISHQTTGNYRHEAVAVGSTMAYARAQELGYEQNNLPPRPFIGPAMAETMDENLDTIGVAIEKSF